MNSRDVLNELLKTQAEHVEVLDAIRDFKDKKEALENSHSDAFNHQSKRVQRRQHELNEAREKLYKLLKAHEQES